MITRTPLLVRLLTVASLALSVGCSDSTRGNRSVADASDASNASDANGSFDSGETPPTHSDARVPPTADARVAANDGSVLDVDARVPVPVPDLGSPVPDGTRPDAAAILPDSLPISLDSSPIELDALVALHDGFVPEPDASPPDAVTPDAASPDASAPPLEGDASPLEPDAAPLPAPPSAPSCQLRAPVVLYDRMYFVDDLALRTADPSPSAADAPIERLLWEPGQSPLAPVASAGLAGEAEIFVSLVGDGCRMLGLDRDAAVVWTASPPATACTRPAVVGPYLLLATSTIDGGELLLLDRVTGAISARAPLPGRATTPVVRVPGLPGDVDPRGHSGSHWLVGADEHVSLFSVETPEAGPALVQRAETSVPGATVTDLMVADSGTGAAVLRRGDEAGLGGAWIGLGLDLDPLAPAVAPLGEPHVTRGPILAPPVGGQDCDNPLAHSGSHWWCPGSVVAFGGEGWVEAFDITSGRSLVQDLIPDLRVTGLALTLDGLIMHSGSHWLPGESQFRLSALDPVIVGPSEQLFVARMGPETCAESPLVIEDGAAAVVVGQLGLASEVFRQGTLAGGLAPAWGRTGGDNQASGQAADPTAPCPGGPKPQFSRSIDALAAHDVRFATGLGDGGLVLGGGFDAGPGASPPFLARVDGAGFLRWRVGYPAVGADGLSFRAAVADGPGIAAVHDIIDAGGRAALRFLRLDGQGAILRDTTISRPAEVSARGLLRRADGTFVILTRLTPVQVDDPETSLLFVDADGVPGRELFTQFPNVRASSFLEFRDGFVIAGAMFLPGSAASYLEAIDPVDGHQLWLQGIEVGGGDTEFVAMTQRGDGEFVVAMATDVAGSRSGSIHRYLPNGAPRTVAEMGDVKIVDLAVAYGSTVYVLTEELRLASVSSFGGIGEVRQALPASAGRLGLGLEADPRGGLLIAALGGEAGAPRPFIERTDPWSGPSCLASGRCVGVDPGTCDDRDPCTEDYCEPSTGLCTARPLADGNPCSDGLFCLGGACQ